MRLAGFGKTLGALGLCVTIVTSPYSASLAGGDVSHADPTVVPFLKPEITRLMIERQSFCPLYFNCY